MESAAHSMAGDVGVRLATATASGPVVVDANLLPGSSGPAWTAGLDPSVVRMAAIAPARAVSRSRSRARRHRPEVSRIIDVAVVIAVLPLALVVAAFVAASIALLDGRPIFFTQQRTGMNGRRFTMYKFRTMVPNADALKAELAARSVVSFPVFKIRDDPRVTRSGRFLRKCFLDELPQLLNVLKGDMGIVGPRPTSAPPSDYVLWQTARLEGRPGLTGLWQTTPDSESLEFSERVRLDIAYLRGRTVMGDLRLICRTVRGCVGRLGH